MMAKYNPYLTKLMFSLIALCLVLIGNSAMASTTQSDWQIEQLIEETERQYAIPSGLLAAIAKIESEMNAYALNINGKAVFANNSVEASDHVESALAKDIRNIDVGVMQLNYRWHGDGFTGIQEMLDPQKNIEYAAIFLLRLKKRHGSWYEAIKYYHSSEPERQYNYSYKVVMEWGKRYA
mgnify:FL=1